jgi:hypothetical protein
VGRAVSRGVTRPDFDAWQHRLATGQETFDRSLVNNASNGGASQSLRLTYFTAHKTQTITQVRVLTGGTPAAATPTLVRFGIYSVAANGDIALIASTANDTTLLASGGTAYTKALQASVGLVAGTRYAFGILVVTGAATPTFPCWTTGLAGTELDRTPRIASVVAAQADLPASVVNASLAASTLVIYSVMLP